MPKRTYQPKIRRRVRVHGFRKRMKSRGGRMVLKNRRSKGRSILSVSKNNHVKRINWNGTRAVSYRAMKEATGGKHS
jgi:large subunit ribosomal protein L34